jgi:hypothetical protein
MKNISKCHIGCDGNGPVGIHNAWGRPFTGVEQMGEIVWHNTHHSLRRKANEAARSSARFGELTLSEADMATRRDFAIALSLLMLA